MTDANRRAFLKQTAAGLAGAAALASARAAKAAAGDQVAVGLIGCGGRGTQVARVFAQMENVAITYVCDPHQERLEQARQSFNGAKAVSDMRQVLADPSVQAVLVATPDHWHSPASILACDAGKDVYVEKPCSHNIREGRLLVEAARRNGRVVQHGTQVRSTSTIMQAVKLLQEGAIGTVLASKAWNIQRRGPIGRAQPSEPPASLDYDLWVGPAPLIPFQSNRTPSGWHWWYHFGTGDMGNDGVHDIDYARWGLGVTTQPSSVAALGGKYFFDDDREFPDTQQVVFEYPGDGAPAGKRMLIYEQRLWSTSYPYNCDSGAEFYGTAGMMFLSRRGKVQLLDDRNQRVELQLPLEAQNEVAHVANFVESVRTRAVPNADIEFGHFSASLCHLGNIATRLGRSLRFNPETEQIEGDEEANRLVARSYRDHWGTPQGA